MLTRLDTIPDELKELERWVCWERRGVKVPKNPHTGRNASCSDISTWGAFDEAVSACKRYGWLGLGFQLAPPYFGIDLDDCATDDHKAKDFALDFAGAIDSYCEYSQSGTGLHFICRGELPEGKRKRHPVEMYQESRYFALTGNVVGPGRDKVTDCTESIKPLFNKYLGELPKKAKATKAARTEVSLSMADDAVIVRARNAGAGNGRLFVSLFYEGDTSKFHGDESRADLSLCNLLAFWCGGDREQMDRIFRQSGLLRPKWDRPTGGTTYGWMTIDKAIADTTTFYNPSEWKKRHVDK